MRTDALAAFGYGKVNPGMLVTLYANGIIIGRLRTARVMGTNVLRARQKRWFKRSTGSPHAFPIAQNLRDQVFAGQALHRVRDQMMGTRTRLSNQMRAFCLEYGIALRQEADLFQHDLPQVLDDASSDLSPAMRKLLDSLFADLRQLDQRISDVTREIEAIAAQEDVARRLMSIPGIGALGATALMAAVGNGRQFQKGRDLAAWLGLVPREYSTGGKQKLLGISKRENRYVRKLPVHDARSCFRHLDRTRDRLGNWLDGLQSRMHPYNAVVALAAKIAPIV